MKLIYTGKTKNVYALDNGHYLLKFKDAYQRERKPGSGSYRRLRMPLQGRGRQAHSDQAEHVSRHQDSFYVKIIPPVQSGTEINGWRVLPRARRLFSGPPACILRACDAGGTAQWRGLRYGRCVDGGPIGPPGVSREGTAPAQNR